MESKELLSPRAWHLIDFFNRHETLIPRDGGSERGGTGLIGEIQHLWLCSGRLYVRVEDESAAAMLEQINGHPSSYRLGESFVQFFRGVLLGALFLKL